MMADRDQECMIDGRRWRRICRDVDVVSHRGFRAELSFDHVIAVFRVDGEPCAVSNICPHQHADMLAEGVVEDGAIVCPLHGWTYDLRTGAPRFGTSALTTYDVMTIDGAIWICVPEETVPGWASW